MKSFTIGPGQGVIYSVAEASKSLGDTVYPCPFAYFCRVVALSTALLIFVGATITTTGSGLAVPDWPFSFGVLNPTMAGGVYYEHGHRLVASAVGFLVLIAAIWAAYSRTDSSVRRLAFLSLGLVIFQGLLGGLTVHMRLPTAVSVAHGTVAQIFFCTTLALVWWTTRSFVDTEPEIQGEAGRNLRIAAHGMTGLIFLQLLVAATMRHMGAGSIIPDFPLSLGQVIPPLSSAPVAINFSHRVLALAILCMACLLCARIFRFHRQQSTLSALGAALVGLVVLQGTLGAFTVWSGQGFWPTCLHVMNGALVLGTAFSISLWTWRLTRQVKAGGPPLSDEGVARRLRDVSRDDWKELTKVRLVTMSVFTALCGYLLGGTAFSWIGVMVAVVGVSLLGAGSGMLNHVVEVETDSLMDRTRNRPLPAGRVDIAVAERTGGLLVAAGTLVLGLWQPWAGLLAFAAFASYVLIYTPMKRYSPSCTVVGAIPGALPVLIGYVARTGTVDLGGGILFAILFLWQLPHFMAIAWLCREDYARAGLPMVTVIDPKGGLAASQILIYSLALIPVSLAPTLAGMTGPVYFYSALILGLVYLYAGAALCLDRTTAKARKLLLTSVIYLPLLYGVMVVGK
ncbi:MAG: heme o synthase [Vulcanimicrobiota bacterium]